MFLIFSIFLLFRGHDAPGGGFTGGLVASAGMVLYGLAFGRAVVRRNLRINLHAAMGTGLLLALVSSLCGLLVGKPFFASVWVDFAGIHLGSPLLFDLGVYVVVVSIVMTILLARQSSEEEEA